MKQLLLGLFLLFCVTSAKAQTTGPAQSDSTVAHDLPFDVTACQTELVGPGQVRSGNWDLVDSVIAKLGKEKALEYFKRHLFDNKAASFYALIGIHKTGTEEEFYEAVGEIEDEQILFQKGCLMIKKPLREAVLIAINDR
jgi:hypothetical protein